MNIAMNTSMKTSHVPTDAVRAEAHPFLKWAGGKRQLLHELLPILRDAGGGTYHEPFLGGGAAFFGLSAEGFMPNAYLSDVNQELITTWEAVRNDPDGVIGRLRNHELRNNEEYFYEVRKQRPHNPAEIAARMIYLNKTCYGGLYRVNMSGQFNVPYGDYKNPNICDEPNLRAVSQVLSTATPQAESFESILDRAVPGDVVYFDPPYIPISETSNFTDYTAGGFGPKKQYELALVFCELNLKSVRVVLSNSDCPEVRRLYEGFQFEQVEARRSINSDVKGRGKVTELIIRNF